MLGDPFYERGIDVRAADTGQVPLDSGVTRTVHKGRSAPICGV